jgi:hypothetical protein
MAGSESSNIFSAAPGSDTLLAAPDGARSYWYLSSFGPKHYNIHYW